MVSEDAARAEHTLLLLTCAALRLCFSAISATTGSSRSLCGSLSFLSLVTDEHSNVSAVLLWLCLTRRQSSKHDYHSLYVSVRRTGPGVSQVSRRGCRQSVPRFSIYRTLSCLTALGRDVAPPVGADRPHVVDARYQHTPSICIYTVVAMVTGGFMHFPFS